MSVCQKWFVQISLAGVAFSIDTETGNNKVILVNGSWGLGEMVVGGMVKPDEFLILKKVF